MLVYKNIMKTFKRSYSIIVPIIIFIIISLLFNYYGTRGNNVTDLSKYNLAIIDESNTELSKSLTKYLETKCKVNHSIKDEESIKNSIFHTVIDYGIIIPKEFDETKQIKSYIYKDFATYNIVNDYINRYINTYQSLSKKMDSDEAMQRTEEILNKKITVKSQESTQKSTINNAYKSFIFMFSYVLLLSLFNSLFAIDDFDRASIKSRILASKITNKDLQKQKVLSLISISLLLFILIIGLSIVFFKPSFVFHKVPLLMIARLLIHISTLTALVYMVHSFAVSHKILSMIGNTLSLGFAFIGGVFIPIRYLSKNIVMFSKLTPTYWFSTGVNSILSTTAISNVVLKGILIEFIMTAAFIIIAYTVRVEKRKKSIA